MTGITDVQRWDLRPGDVLLVRLPEDATPEALARYDRWLRQRLGDAVRVIVTRDDVRFSVMRPGEVAHIDADLRRMAQDDDYQAEAAQIDAELNN